MQAVVPSSRPSPSPNQISKSFSRLDSPPPNEHGRSRSSTMSGGNTASETSFLTDDVVTSPENEENIFSRADETMSVASGVEPGQLLAPQTFDELPIEIRSLTER